MELTVKSLSFTEVPLQIIGSMVKPAMYNYTRFWGYARSWNHRSLAPSGVCRNFELGGTIYNLPPPPAPNETGSVQVSALAQSY